MATSDNLLAGASDTTGEPLARRQADEAVEISPIVMYGKGDLESEAELYDFVPHEEEEVIGLEDEDFGDDEGPKDSPAPDSALLRIYRETQTPMPQPSEESASVEKGSTSTSPTSQTPTESSTSASASTLTMTSGSETPPAADPA